MKKSLLFVLFSFFLSKHCLLMAQTEQHFRAGIAAGINLSQINGDNQDGYHKLGLSVGVKGAYCLKPNFDISTELLYNSRGCRPNPSESEQSLAARSSSLTSTLNYADVLLAANFHFSPRSDYAFYRQSLQIGVSYGRLLSSDVQILRGKSADVAFGNNIQDKFRKDDISFVIGYSWFVTSRFGVTAKHTFSLRDIYVNPLGAANQEYYTFTPYNLSIQLAYNLISPKLDVAVHVAKAKKEAARKNRNPLEDL